MTAATETGTADRTRADDAPGRCRYPGCASPARCKDPAAPGPRPGYCEQEVPEDRGDGTPVLVRHTAMTAFRRRQQLTGQPGQDRPVTAAISRAAAIRDDAIAAMSRLGAQLSAALDQQRHAAELAATAAQLAAANDTIAALRDQLARDQAALDRERAGQHKTVSLLHDLLASRPAAPAGSDGQQPYADGSTGHQPADTAGNGTSRRQAPR